MYMGTMGGTGPVGPMGPMGLRPRPRLTAPPRPHGPTVPGPSAPPGTTDPPRKCDKNKTKYTYSRFRISYIYLSYICHIFAYSGGAAGVWYHPLKICQIYQN